MREAHARKPNWFNGEGRVKHPPKKRDYSAEYRRRKARRDQEAAEKAAEKLAAPSPTISEIEEKARRHREYNAAYYRRHLSKAARERKARGEVIPAGAGVPIGLRPRSRPRKVLEAQFDPPPGKFDQGEHPVRETRLPMQAHVLAQILKQQIETAVRGGASLEKWHTSALALIDVILGA